MTKKEVLSSMNSLKASHPLSYISDHVKTHSLFEEVFKV